MELKNQKRIMKGLALTVSAYFVALTMCGEPKYKNDEGIRFLYWNQNNEIAVYVDDGEKYGLLNFDNEGNFLRSKKSKIADELTPEMYRTDYPKLTDYALSSANSKLSMVLLDKIYPVAESYQKDSLKTR